MIVTPCVDLWSCFCRAISPSLGFHCLLRILGVCVSCGLPARECSCWMWPLGISKYWEWTFRSGDGLEGEWGGLEFPLKEGKLSLLEGSDFMATMAWGLSCKRVVLPVKGWDKGMGWGRRVWGEALLSSLGVEQRGRKGGSRWSATKLGMESSPENFNKTCQLYCPPPAPAREVRPVLNILQGWETDSTFGDCAKLECFRTRANNLGPSFASG